MTYFQTIVSHPGAQGAGRPTGSGYLPITSPGYIANPSGQQYMQIQPSTFFQPQNLQGTYAEVAPRPSTRIEINPTALAYQSYTSPSPPAHNNQQYNGGGDPRYQGGFQTEGNQIYQDRPKQYQIQSLFHQYQNGPEVMSVSSPQTCPQHPMTPPTLKSPIQTFNVSAPSLGESTELTTKPDTTNGLTLSYPDDQSMFVKDSGQGIAASSSSAEDVFKAKASLYGIEICTRAEGLASAGKQRQVLCDDLTSSMNDMEVKGEKVPEMLFQMTHIEPEESNESDDSATTSTEASIKCTNVSQQSISDSDTNYYAKNIGKISNQYLMTSEDINGCVVYSESVEHELKEKNKDEVISITANSWSKGSCTSSLDHTGEYFITVQDENASSTSDEEIGIFRNYVLEAVMPSQKNKKTGAQKKLPDHPTFESELCKTIMTSVGSEELKQEQKSNGTFDVLVEEFVKTIIIKACEAVAEQNGLSGGYHPAHVKEELADVEVNNNSCCEDKTDSEKLDLVEGYLQNFKDQDEADDKQISHHIDVGDHDSKEEPVDQISEPSLVLSSSWDMAWNQNIKSKDENSNHCSDNVMNGKRFHCDSESTEQSSDYSDSASQLNPISPEFKPRRYLKNKTFMRPDAPAFQPFNVQDVKRTTKEESCG
ncbi:uncharacterized protein LOC132562719 [Ylistrum balloti]|uniref:uncharacterized protein LOC132562719 n=1 Tax=Ylistrum balloti TaxID=509963 RepID=UPI0029059ED4|nr:uncharacterized protein LOC132562719 [Ylistrum balloti]